MIKVIINVLHRMNWSVKNGVILGWWNNTDRIVVQSSIGSSYCEYTYGYNKVF